MGKAEISSIRNDSFIMARPRVEALLSAAMEKPVTLIHAGAGCGKSCAMYSYLSGIEARVIWIQLSEADNTPSRFWENVCNTVANIDDGSNSAMILTGMGFPGSGERYKLCYDMILDILKPNLRYVIVFDDVHLINDADVRSFMLALANTPFPGLSNIFISREASITTYDVDTPDEDFVVIDEHDLLFTKAEVADYLSMLEVHPSHALVDEIYSASEGLAHLINLAGKLIKKRPESTNQIGDVIRLNVSKIIDENFFEESTDDMKKFLVKLSLLDHLSHSLVHSLPGGYERIAEAMKMTTMIRSDVYMHDYRLHNIFTEFLADKEYLLTGEEKFDTYRMAAEWCSENNYRLEAIGYYEKMGDYTSIVSIASSMLLDIDFHSGTYLLDILERAAPGLFEENPGARVLYTRMLLSLGRADEAIEKLQEFILSMESQHIGRDEAEILIWLYNNMGFAKILKATDAGGYDFAESFMKASEYMKKAGIEKAPFTINVSIMPYACVVGSSKKGEPERFIEEIARSIPYTGHTLGGCLYGADDLTMSEVAYYRSDMAACERYAIQSCLKAKDKGQSYIEGRALFLLLRMNLSRGRFDKINEVLTQYDQLMKRSDNYMERIQHDIVLSWYYASIGETDNVAPWVKGDFMTREIDAYINGLEDMTKIKYYLCEKKHHALLAYLDRRPTTHGVRKFILGRIGMAASEAVCLYNIKDRKGAIESLRMAYEMSAPNAFDMSFIEMGNNMRSLAGAALREKDCGIPVPWLESVRSRAATYAKRIAHVKSRYRQAVGKEGNIQLTLKEKEVLQDMSQGLSRTEIAAYRGISINTVKAMLQIIYEKLGADNSMDALRIAISNHLI
ncbi:MAG: LuxR C-terminal-related transcriptional regulator [Clostridiales Family XIII bacterium]|jgi:ATP/maltotriose-dependent transcriptional regulator MalT|nr:LuxR C-terminal-related transcriptional regulator [Clostridiales Family XIII bacterium]